MASISNSERKTFMADVSLSYIKGSKVTEIEPDKIRSIVISHDYETKVMPVIVLSLCIGSELYSDIVNYKDVSKIYLKIQFRDANSDTSIARDYINDQFTYFLSSTSPNYSKTLNEANTNADSDYKTLYIGLMSMTLMNDIRSSFNGVFKDIDQNTLIQMALNGTNVVLKEPTYNNKYDAIIIPPIDSRSKMISYIFDMDPFYDTDYLYFMDFDESYLLSRDGIAVHQDNGTLDDIIIDVRDVTSEEAYYEGMQIKNNAYYIYVNPANCNVSINQCAEKVANRIVGFSEDKMEIVDLDINRSLGSDVKIAYHRTSNVMLYKNSIESSSLTIEVVKENIDSRVITPNKSIMVSNYEEFSDYNGKYLLMYKHEVITGNAGEFTVTSSFGLKKLGNITGLGNSTLTNVKKGVTSSTQKYTTTRTTKSSKSRTTSTRNNR